MPARLIYVASPLGFNEPGRAYLRDVLHPAIESAGLAVLDPWAVSTANRVPGDAAPGDELELSAWNAAIGAKNRALIETAAGVLAVLDGPDVDSGTAAEVGFAAAIGCPVVGLRTDSRRSGDNAAAVVNLQVVSFIVESGGGIERDLEAALRRLVALASQFDDPRIYHLCERSEWERALGEGEYRRSTREATLEEVGYIHASFRRQLRDTAAKFYSDVEPGELVLLEIDRRRCKAEVRVEEAAGGSDRFPHLYGPLNLDAVVAVRFDAAGAVGLPTPN